MARYGAHMEGHVVNGLDRQPLASIAATIASLGFNCVRLPFSLEQYYDNPYIEVRISQLTVELETNPHDFRSCAVTHP